MRLPKLVQPTLTDEFRPYVAPVVQVQKIRRAALLARVRVKPLSAEEARMARRREHEGEQLRRTLEFQRLIAGGMSRVDANRKVFG